MDTINSQSIRFSKDIASDMTAFPNTAVTNSTSGISFENYLKAVNDSIEKQERRERNDYSDRKEYQKDPYIERRDPYAKDRYNEETSRNGGFASADRYNKPTNKSMYNTDNTRSPITTANNGSMTRDNYDNNEKTISQEYNKVERNPIHIGDIYQNRSKDVNLGESKLTNTRSSSENLSIASLAYKLHSLLNVENLGDESLIAGETSLDDMSMKDLLSIINGMSKEELDALTKLVDVDNVGISELELSNLGEIEDLIAVAQQKSVNNKVETGTENKASDGLPLSSDKSGLLDEQDIINFYQSNTKTEKTTNDSLLVESLKANKDMLLTEGNILSADVIIGGSKNRDINKIDTSIIDLIKQVSSKDNDEDSLLDLIKKVTGDIDTQAVDAEVDNSNEDIAQSSLKELGLSEANKEVISNNNDVSLKDSKTLSFDDLVKAINADTSKNIPETTQEVLVDSESTNIKSEEVKVVDSQVLDEQATSFTNNEMISTLEDSLNRLTKSNIVEDGKSVPTNDKSVEEIMPKLNNATASVNSIDVKPTIDKAFMITEEENRVIDAMKKSLFTEDSVSKDAQNSQTVNKVSMNDSLSKLNKDALAVASSQSKDFKDVLKQDIVEENLESGLESESEYVSKNISQEDEEASNGSSGRGNQLLEDMEEANKSESLTVEESVVADSSDNDNPSFKLNEQATKNNDKVDISKQSSSSATMGNNSSGKNDNLVNSFNNNLNQVAEKATETPKSVAQQRGNPVPVYDLKNSNDIGKLVKSIDQSILKGESKLTVNLYPEHLGKLEIQLAEVAGKMTAKFITESESSHKIMISQTEALRNHLAEKGIVVDNMEFKFDDSSRQQQQQQQQQAENERRLAAKNGSNKKNENRDSSLERDNSINFRAKAKPGIYA